MAPKVTKVTNDEEYHEMAMRIIKASLAIENPLTSELDRQRYRTAYDEMCGINDYYRHTQLAREFPGLKKVYKEIGYEFDESDPEPIKAEQPEPIQPIAEEKPLEPTPSPKTNNWWED